MKAIRALNNYFLVVEEGEEIHVTDLLYFYGQYVVYIGITLFAVL